MDKKNENEKGKNKLLLKKKRVKRTEIASTEKKDEENFLYIDNPEIDFKKFRGECFEVSSDNEDGTCKKKLVKKKEKDYEKDFRRSKIELTEKHYESRETPKLIILKDNKALGERNPEAASYGDYRDENDNYDHYYNVTPMDKKIIMSKWEDINEMFRFNLLKRRKDLKIEDIGEVKGHFIYALEMYYIFNTNNEKEDVILRLDDCFSLDLFCSVRNYLVNDTSGKTKNIAETTKYSEIYNYYETFKEMFNPKITLKELISSGATDRTNRRKNLNSKEIFVRKLEEIVDVYITCDNITGISIKGFKDNINFSFEEFEDYCSPEIYEDLMKKIIKGSLVPRKDKRRMCTIKESANIRKRNPEKKDNLSRKIRIDEDRNEGNCFLYALKSLINIFPIDKFRDTFKETSLSMQFKTANTFLNEYGKELIEIRHEKGYLGNFINSSDGLSIIVFYNEEIKTHAEALCNGNVIDKKRDGLRDYFGLILEIKEYIIVDVEESQKN